MDNATSRLDDLRNVVLNVANREGGQLNLDTLSGSKLSLNFDYFAPGMKAVVLGCKNRIIPYLAARRVYPGGSVEGCFSDSTDFEESKEKFIGSINNSEQAAETRFHYTPNGDLKTRYSEVERYLEGHPVNELKNYRELENFIATLKNENPLISDNSIDIVALDALDFVVGAGNFWNMITEIYRVLKKGGIFLFSSMLSDEKAIEQGYLCEEDLDAFTGTYKFYGLQCIGRSELPFKVINGKEIRFHNFVAFKGKEGRCMERNQAVIYNGPWKEIRDDDGHVYPRGKRVAVCDKTFNILLNTPSYKGQFTYVNPYIDIPLENAVDFPCCAGILFRDSKVTKGLIAMSYSTNSQDSCGSGGNSGSSCCC